MPKPMASSSNPGPRQRRDDRRNQHYHHQDPSKKRRRSPSSSSSTSPNRASTANPHSSSTPRPKRPIFPSYLDTPNLPGKIRLLCEIVASTPSPSVESFLDDTGFRLSQPDVEQVLKLSYSSPGSAVKFFRWAGRQLADNHSPYSWNLVVDLLGKNSLFDAMWDAIKSMRHNGLVSLATFASVFGSYVIAGKVKEAILTFEVMDKYGCPRDVVALNSLLSAICRDGQTVDAVDVLRVARDRIRPDSDSYAILLEGWEKEMNVLCARETFAEMVTEIGWDPHNVPAYDTFLSTLLVGHSGLYEAIKCLDSMIEKGCYPGMKFFRLAFGECLKRNDLPSAEVIWGVMVDRIGLLPDTELHNVMVALHCYNNNDDVAKKILDGMVYNGVFPDVQTYNVLFQFLIKGRKLKEASDLFNEMIRNEFVPSHSNCSTAVRMFIDSKEPYMAIKIWKCMIEHYESDLEETGNLLVVGLRNLFMIPEAVKYAEGMIEKRIKLNSSTLAKLKQSLTQEKKVLVYEELLRKWRAR